jgi:hypothetical protein
MQLEAVLAKSLRQDIHDSTRVRLVGENHRGIVGKTDQHGAPCEPGSHFLFEPLVQHIVQVEVREDR